jgi:hypothetical protein
MSVTQYIGARYVPLFAYPLDWDINSAYEPLTIVYHQGNSYTSRQSVPKGIDITNDSYWAITGNYNAQIEQYRREVRAYEGRITANAQAIADEVTARMTADETIRGIIDDLQGDLSDEVTARSNADTQIRTDFEAADTQIRTDFAAADTQLRSEIGSVNTAITNSNMRVSRSLNNFMGVCAHDLAATTAQKYADYGFKRVRIDLTWSDVEHQRGIYDFSTYDTIAENARDNGIGLLFVLDYNNTLYANSTNDPITTEQNRNAFVAYARAAVTHFSSYDCEWEIWNEANFTFTAEQYFQLVSAVYPAIKNVSNNANVVIGCIAYNGTLSGKWWYDVCALGALSYCDKTSLHFYVYDRAPETYCSDIVLEFNAVNLIFNKNKQIPWVISEIGYTIAQTESYHPTDALRAKLLTREVLELIRIDVDSVYIYEGKSRNSGDNPEWWFGLFNDALQPTETAKAIKTLNEFLSGVSFSGALYANAGINIYSFYDHETKNTLYVKTYLNNSSLPLYNSPSEGFNPIDNSQIAAINYLKCGVKVPGIHAETFNDSNVATGQYSHAEGLNNTANGYYSHVGGKNTDAIGEGAFAHGDSCSSTYAFSGAIGDHLLTGMNHQFVCGRNNAENNQALFVIGCGDNPSNRKNAFEVRPKGFVMQADDGSMLLVHIVNGQLVVSNT